MKVREREEKGGKIEELKLCRHDYMCCQLRTRRALMLFDDVQLRTRRALLPFTLYSESTLLVLNGTLLNSDNTLLTLN